MTILKIPQIYEYLFDFPNPLPPLNVSDMITGKSFYLYLRQFNMKNAAGTLKLEGICNTFIGFLRQVHQMVHANYFLSHSEGEDDCLFVNFTRAEYC